MANYYFSDTGTGYWDDPMVSPAAGTKRGQAYDSHGHREDGNTANMLYYTYGEGPDSRADTDNCCSRPPCCSETEVDGRPSKRQRALASVGESNSDLDAEHLFLETTCYDTYCRECTPCASPEECSPESVCYDPHCDQVKECADSCVDPECSKGSKCDAAPCPLADLAEECQYVHSAPSPDGTIYCFDETQCHFKNAGDFAHPSLPAYDGYHCASPSPGTLGQCNVTTQPSPAPSQGGYTSLDSAFSSHASPFPNSAFTTDQSCFLDTTYDHCHIDNSCCHGPSRACGDYPNAPQNTFGLWNLSLGQNYQLNNANGSFPMVHGVHSGQYANTFSMDPSTSAPNTIGMNPGYSNNMPVTDNSWLLPESRFGATFPNPGPYNKLDYLASAVQEGMMKPGFIVASNENWGSNHQATTSQPLVPVPQNKLDYLASAVQADMMKAEPRSAGNETWTFNSHTVASQSPDIPLSICKWQHAPNVTCLETFDCAEALHKHIKAAHVDKCTRCFCQWEGCESCDKDFKQRSKLSRHLLAHAGYRPHACSWEGCNKTFATNQAKDNHERTHSGDRPYVCGECGYMTTTHTQLQTHISAKHEKTKRHACRFCGFTCADSSNLSKHERTHQALRPYRCPHDGCTFKPDCRWENLKRHLRRSNHCPELLVEGSAENVAYKEKVRLETEEWHKRNEGSPGVIGGRRKARA